jgi:transcriptional regulator with GAF, ATPase, and Fis domain
MPKPALDIQEHRIIQALETNKGNQRAAAQQLGTSQGWLAIWLKRNNYRQVIKWEKVQS